MENLQKIFKKVGEIEPSEGLYSNILNKIELKQKKKSLRNFVLSIASLIVSLLAISPVIKYVVDGFANSGFYQYVSLIFSDGNLMNNYWMELILSIVESLPALSVIALLLVIFTILYSLKSATKNLKEVFLRTKLV